MSQRDLVYVGHMLDLAAKAVTKTEGISCGTYDTVNASDYSGVI